MEFGHSPVVQSEEHVILIHSAGDGLNKDVLENVSGPGFLAKLSD